VSDDSLNTGENHKSGGGNKSNKAITNETQVIPTVDKANWEPNSGSYSRFFDLDAWFEKKLSELPESVQRTFPFLITPKPSKAEKNKGLEDIDGNKHPTCKPIKLMSWLITLGSREGDIVLDPFAGSGTTLIAAKILRRNYIGIEREQEYKEIADARIKAWEPEIKQVELNL
jgi:DNA modification methylase